MWLLNKALGLIGISAKAGKIVYGTDSCIEKMKSGKVKLLIVSTESSEKSKKNFEYYAQKYNTKICFFETIENLSKSIGKKNKVVIGIQEDNLAKEIQKIIDGGEVIG